MAARTVVETPFEKTKLTNPNPLRATLTQGGAGDPRFPPIGENLSDLENFGANYLKLGAFLLQNGDLEILRNGR